MNARRLVLALAAAALSGIAASPCALAADTVALKRIQVEPRQGTDFFIARFLVDYNVDSMPEAVLQVSVQGADSSIIPVTRQRLARGRAEVELVAELKRSPSNLLKARATLTDPKPPPDNVVRVSAWHELGFTVPTAATGDRIDIRSIETRPGKRPEYLVIRVDASYVLESRAEASLVLYADAQDVPGVHWQLAEERIVRGSGSVPIVAEVAPNPDRSTLSVKLELRRYPRPPADFEEADRTVVRTKAMPPR